jgi:hypothetical protein
MRAQVLSLVLGMVLVSVGLGIGVVADRAGTPGAVPTPTAGDCTVIGWEGTVQITGVGAADACHQMTGSSWKALDPGTQDSSEIDCQVHFAGLTFTVRLGQYGIALAPGQTIPPDPCSALQVLGAG